MSRTSALAHLSRLPDVFDLGQFVLTGGVSPASAKVMLSRWASQGLIEHAGPQSGIYFKRLNAKMGRDDMLARAILTVYPSAVVGGASVLHAHGWTTQIPRSLHIRVGPGSRSVKFHAVEISNRSLHWYRVLQENRESAFDCAVGAGPWSFIRKLSPAWALVDLFKHGQSCGEWIPDPDDLDIPQSCWGQIEEAACALGLPFEILTPYALSCHEDEPASDSARSLDY